MKALMYKKLLYLATGTMVLAGMLLTINTFADGTDVVDRINITVSISCTLEGTGMNSHNAEILNGQYNSSIGETTLKAFCNDNEGFAIYAIGYTDNEDGKNVLTNTTLGSTYDIGTGTATSDNDSKWAMKLSTTTSPAPTYPIIISGSTDDTDKVQGDLDYSSFQEVPDDYVKVAYRKASTDVGANAEGSTLKTTYQAYISKTQPAGTYTGQVKYTMVHPYDAVAPTIPLTIATATTMQEVEACPASLPEEQVYTLTDTRDNQDYKVAKLKDGKCWMVENLNIAGGTALSSEDTDFESTYTLPTTGNWTVTDGKLVLPASATKNPDNNNLTDNSQFGTDNYAFIFNSGNKENCGTSGQNIPCYSYYSWDVATLGSGRSIDQDNTDAPYSICPKNWRLPTSGSSLDNNWKRGDFYTLAISYGANLENDYVDSSATGANFYNNAGPSTPSNFLIAGSYASGSFEGGGGYGIYWSSTSISTSSRARIFSFDSSRIFSASTRFRSDGVSVRCLLSE